MWKEWTHARLYKMETNNNMFTAAASWKKKKKKKPNILDSLLIAALALFASWDVSLISTRQVADSQTQSQRSVCRGRKYQKRQIFAM